MKFKLSKVPNLGDKRFEAQLVEVTFGTYCVNVGDKVFVGTVLVTLVIGFIVVEASVK